MDQSKRSREAQPPPPYSQGYRQQNNYGQQNTCGQQNPYGQNNYSSPHYGLNVGPGNIAVVSPADQYGDMGERHAENQQQQWATPLPLPPDYSTGLEDTGCFDDKAIRRGFIKKVYLTLMIQLLVTFGIICAFLYWEALRVWSMNTNWFSFSMIAVVFVIIIALSCCVNIRRKVPLNFLALGLFTIAEGLLLGSLTVFYEAEAVMWAVGATALVSLALSVFAMQSRWDFTLASGGLWVFCWTLIAFALLCGIMRSQHTVTPRTTRPMYMTEVPQVHQLHVRHSQLDVCKTHFNALSFFSGCFNSHFTITSIQITLGLAKDQLLQYKSH
uniref:Uncharacterized protein n=1 Tax=Hucho hucho TaxID=62062 RepID=A0A4W5QV36_9TELE